MTERTLKTELIWHDSTGMEISCTAVVTYSVDPGYAGDRTDPPQDASVEIIDVSAVDPEYDIPERAIDLDCLAEECLADWREDLIAAEEYRAEQRRDDAMMERWS